MIASLLVQVPGNLVLDFQTLLKSNAAFQQQLRYIIVAITFMDSHTHYRFCMRLPLHLEIAQVLSQFILLHPVN